uniref:(California timema) hypothetical protein n=1 Tax=Timema californicum TaxID=61474 RepID=A0A7R9PES7_TIMCA|nr:unnamed protein product [Timema californicum]
MVPTGAVHVTRPVPRKVWMTSVLLYQVQIHH